MNATIEPLETLRTPLANVTPVMWRDGGMCGLASVRVTPTYRIVPTYELTWLLEVIARAM